MEKIVVAFASGEAQSRIRRLLKTEGCEIAGCCFTGAETIRAVRKLGGAIVVCGFKLPDMTANDLAASLRGMGALLVVSSAVNLNFCRGENLAKLATPAARSDFFASLNLLRQNETGRLRRAKPQRQEEDRQLIFRAKELLMETNRMTENEAHRFLQKRSMDTGRKLTETARLTIDTYGGGLI